MSDQRPAVSVCQKIPIFRTFNETECRQMADVTTVEHYAPGEPILRQGEKDQNLWIVLSGKCEVVRSLTTDNGAAESIVLAELEPFSHFGDMSFFHAAPHSATVRAQSAVEVLRLKRGDFDDMVHEGMQAAYKLAYNAVDGLANRLRRMDQWVAELTRQTTTENKPPEWNVFRDRVFRGWNL